MEHHPTTQLKEWKGTFGDGYTARNELDPATRYASLYDILDGLRITNVLEVGCNRGHNLLSLDAMGRGFSLTGLEPNNHARELATKQGLVVVAGDIYELPFPDGYFDLVFTAGVLIHVPPARLNDALSEIHRVSRRFILAMEYWAEDDVEVSWGGYGEMLWKRPFLRYYTSQFPDLELVRMGDLHQENGFVEGTRYWLLRKGW